MRIDISGNRLELTPSLKAYITEKMDSVARILSRFEQAGELELLFEIARSTKHHRHGDVFYAEATLALPGKTLRIEEYAGDARAAVDAVKDRLRVDVKKYKDRREARTARIRPDR